VWPNPRVVKFVNDNFRPARVHVKDDADLFQRYGQKYSAQWTPTILELDSDLVERHRIEGFLPTEEFLPQLMLGRAQIAFAAEKWDEAAKIFRQIVEEFPDSDAAPEALYWAGVAPYKASHDPTSLKQTADAFRTRYQGTSWAKKASIWA
jgi:hypothetical protein